MHAAILLFDGFTALDAVTPHAALSSAGIDVTFVAETIGAVHAEVRSLELTANAALGEVPAPDIIVVPGGVGAHRYLRNGAVHRWLRAADVAADAVLAVGTGALVVAAAGLLAGRRVAASDQARAFLIEHGALPTSGPIAIDGTYGTAVDAAGVNALVRDLLTQL